MSEELKKYLEYVTSISNATKPACRILFFFLETVVVTYVNTMDIFFVHVR